MSSAREYDDGLIQLDGRAITLRRFHFPSGTSKVVPLGSIRTWRAEQVEKPDFTLLPEAQGDDR